MTAKMLYELDEEFNTRVKHNFKIYMLLTSKSMNWKQEDILDSIFRLNGYKCHKTVKYGVNSSHIHVKFEEEYMATEAVEFLNKLNTDLSAVLVDDMLRDWFNYEMKCGYSPPWTLTIVDITGSPPLSLNFLTENILNSILQNFGGPYLLPYTAAMNEPHVQILFGSMTEALAACMAFGEWYYRDQKIDSFYYRVRINPSDKEAKLIKHSGGTPKEAFKLDYFVNVKKELIQSRKVNDPDSKQKTPRYKSVQSKGTQKSRKQKLVPVVNTEPKQNSSTTGIGHRTPILCVPVIAPFNTYAEALMNTSRRFNVDFASALLNIQQTCAVSTQSIVDTVDYETNFHQSVQLESIESSSSCSDVGSLEQHALALEQEPLVQLPEKAATEMSLVPTKQMPGVATKSKRTGHKGSSRVFDNRR